MPFIALSVYCIMLYDRNDTEIREVQKKHKTKLKEDRQTDIELPLISVCSRNQFSQRDADKVFEMEEYRDLNAIFYKMVWLTNVTLNASQAMSVFRNFAMHEMDANEIDGFTDDQIDYLLHHRKTFSNVIKHQVSQVLHNTFIFSFLVS